MSLRTKESLCGPLTAVRHRTACLARWMGLPGVADAPDFLSIRYWQRTDPLRPTAAPSRHPVLLVHGYAGTEHMWHPLRAALADAGFDQLIALRYNTFRAEIHEVADWLVDQAERTMAACGSGRVHLIGHSMGGLVVRDAVQLRGLGGRVAAAVTLATPHHGSSLARFVPGACARQMHPGSAFLRRLANADRRSPTRWIDIRGDGDRVVAPGDDPVAADAVRVRAGHRSIARHPDVVDRIVRELTASEEIVDPAIHRDAAREFTLAA